MSINYIFSNWELFEILCTYDLLLLHLSSYILWLHMQAEKEPALVYSDGIPELCIIFFENTLNFFPFSPSKEYEIKVLELFVSIQNIIPLRKTFNPSFLPSFLPLTTFQSYSFLGQVYKQPLSKFSP